MSLADASQLYRLVTMTDKLNETLNRLVTEIELLKQRTAGLEERFDVLEQHANTVQPVPWQNWIIAIAGLILAIALALLTFRISLGGN